MAFLKKTNNQLRLFNRKMKFYYSVNWTKTLYFNFKKLPFETAKQLPVFFYGKVKLKSISGQIIINAPVRRGMIGFGQSYELTALSKGTAVFLLEGTIIFNGHVQIGKDYTVYVLKDGILSMGNMSSLGSNGKIICYKKITVGNFARIGYESQLLDTNAHQMYNTKTGEKYPLFTPIVVGNYNNISNRVTILAGAKTPDYCTIGSNSLCSRDYLSLGINVMIGGVPAELIKTDISRDWDGESEKLIKWCVI